MKKLGLFKRILLLSCALMLSLFPCASMGAASSAANAEVLSVTSQYVNIDSSSYSVWTYDYCDSWFDQDASVYNHKLAQVSFGFASSCFRDTLMPLGQQERNGIAFLTEAGFTGLQSDGYPESPTATSIATLIGHKQLGSFTLIAVGICGNGYGAEWSSNMDIGTGLRHEGFQLSSEIVQGRIRQYIADQGLTGTLRLWVTGYSRAAAVSNITAADMTDSGLFDGVFAYTFATPRTTREESPKVYSNIFNIVGSNDVVPMVPLADWGFTRYGVDLYTPSQETDSSYQSKQAAATEVALKLSGKAFRSNPTINFALRNVLAYLLDILPDTEDYVRDMQPEAMSLMADQATENLAVNFSSILSKLDNLTEEQRADTNQLLDYLQYIAFGLMQENNAQVSGGHWDAESGLTDNVMHEHNPDVYLEWLLSTEDPSALYQQETRSLRFVITAKNVHLYFFNDSGLVTHIHPNGETSYDLPADYADFQKDLLLQQDESLRSSVFTEKDGSRLIAVLPNDQAYLITLVPEKDEDFSYFLSSHNSDSVLSRSSSLQSIQGKANTSYYVYVSPDDEDQFIASDQDANVESWNYDIQYSPSLILALENANIFHLTIPTLLLIVFVVVCILLLLLLISIFTAVLRRIRKKERLKSITVMLHLLTAAIFFLLEEGTRQNLGVFIPLRLVFKGLTGFCIWLLAFRGYRLSPNKLNKHIVLFLLACIAGDILLTLQPLFAVPVYCLAIIWLCHGFWKAKKPERWQLLLGLGLWTANAVVMLFFREGLGVYFWYFLVGDAFLSAMVVLSLKQRPSTCAATLLLSAADILQTIFYIIDGSASFQMLSMLLYYASLALMAVSAWDCSPRRRVGLPKEEDKNDLK